MTHDVIVIGCGAMGSAAAWRLARRGVRVLAVDRFAPPHAMGSSHGQTRMTRTAYYEHADYVPLLLRSHALWRELEKETRPGLLHMVGGLYMGPADGELISGSLRSAREHGLDHELLPFGELRRRFPMFAPAEGSVGLLERTAGYLMVEACVGSMVHAACAAGAEVHTGECVLDVSERAGHVEVRTERGTYEAGQAVVAAGAWASRLLPEIPKVTPTRQTLGWVWPREHARFTDIPAWAFDVGGGHLLYGFPMLPDRPGLKAAHHAPGPAVDADAVPREITAADEASLRALLGRHVPLAADGPMLSMATCLYENSPDGHFLLGKLSDRLTVAAGFSGHGFKFAPAVGEACADLALTGATPLPVAFLHPDRFFGR